MTFICIILGIVLILVICGLIRHWIDERARKKSYMPTLNKLQELYPEAKSEVDRLLDINHYFTNSEFESAYKSLKEIKSIIKQCIDNNALRYLGSERSEEFQSFYNVINDLEKTREQHNVEFVKNQLKVNKEYFDHLLRFPLDNQQREAIVTLEDNTLVVSAAGSGKSTTIEGKVRYLIEKRKVEPKKILLITFTRKASTSLSQRLDGYSGLECHTFHSFARYMIGQITHRAPSVAPENLLNDEISKFLNDPRNVLSIEKYLRLANSRTDLFSSNNNEFGYLRNSWDNKTINPRFAKYDASRKSLGVKSQQEADICDFLYLNGIAFDYEAPYEYNTATAEYGQYHPDFKIYYVVNGMRKHVYLEHFAIDEHGNTPPFFTDRNGSHINAHNKYVNGIVWKRDLHRNNHTTLIETTSAMFNQDTWEGHLLSEFRRLNIPTNPRNNTDEIYASYGTNQSKVYNSLKRFVGTFVSLLKANNKSISDVRHRINALDFGSKFILDKIISPIFDKYQASLRAGNYLDFSDLIIQATELCNSSESVVDYDYIIIDEFQDISLDRYNFIKSLRRRRGMTKMFCVGDDWQSIFRFSGSDLGLFKQFSSYFGFTKECKIETTYRFKHPLLYESSKFIQMNESQKKKNVRPIVDTAIESELIRLLSALKSIKKINYGSKDTDEGEIEKFYANRPIFVYNPINQRGEIINYKDYLRRLLANNNIRYDNRIFSPEETALSFLPYERYNLVNVAKSLVDSIPDGKSILLLSRYSFTFDEFSGHPNVTYSQQDETGTITINGKQCRFMTVHKVKGLEADYVILLACNEGLYGFPSKVEDHKILSYLLSEEDQYEYGEERRLFYVAVTRAKVQTFILYENRNMSRFLSEIGRFVRQVDGNCCPQCEQSSLQYRKTFNSIYRVDEYCINPQCRSYNRATSKLPHYSL